MQVHEQFMELKTLASVEGGSRVYRERQKRYIEESGVKFLCYFNVC